MFCLYNMITFCLNTTMTSLQTLVFPSEAFFCLPCYSHYINIRKLVLEFEITCQECKQSYLTIMLTMEIDKVRQNA